MQCNQEFWIPGVSVSACLFSWFSVFISLPSRWQSKSWLTTPLITNKWLNTDWRVALLPQPKLGFADSGGRWGQCRDVEQAQDTRSDQAAVVSAVWWTVLPPLPLVQSGSPKSILLSRAGNMKEMIKFPQIREDCRTGLERQCFLISSASTCVCLCESTSPQ